MHNKSRSIVLGESQNPFEISFVLTVSNLSRSFFERNGQIASSAYDTVGEIFRLNSLIAVCLLIENVID
jgi:hypothetical protein